MKSLLGATILAAGLLVTLAAQTRNANHGINISTSGNAQSCADLKVQSNGELAQAAEKFTLGPNEASALEMNGLDHGVIQVRGWTQNSYQVEACKIAAAEDRATAEQTLHGISVTHSAGRFSYSGPGETNARWQVYFFVRTPPNAHVDLETKNGPVSVADVDGSVKLRAANGPIAIRNTTGTIDAESTNGPISYQGESGDVRLQATNGPISIKLANDVWNGAGLNAQTNNGPVSLSIPSSFRSGVRIENDGSSPISCRACKAAAESSANGRRVIQMNGASDTVRVSTHNGPISVSNPAAKKTIL